ncbi:ABC transporter permease subunit [Marinobacterium aestuariivivens]|uniref:ABC transporter permease subunit n=1 Tax=Marinobacterium aestuariivivens TaxID=1698799 RepID=A0ABW2A6B9_9GAMM
MIRFGGKLALALSLLLTALAFYGLIGFDRGGLDRELLADPYFYSVLRFSIKQAVLSALLSLLLAWPIARALHYCPGLPLRRSFLNLCILCFVMPTLVLITGLVALMGRSGLITPLLGSDWNLYGLNGILIAHVYLNLPFAVRVLLLALQHIPDSSWKLAAQLKLTPWQRLHSIEWPALQASLLQLFGFVFVLCFNSFAVVLALGGGPRATTLEVAIYQALKYDFNIPEALTLAWAQLLIAGSLFLLLTRLGGSHWLGVDTAARRWTPRATRMLPFHRLVYGAAWLALLLPILALLPGLLETDLARFDWRSILRPALVTLGLGLFSGLGALLSAYLMLAPVRAARLAGQTRRSMVLEWLSTHALVAPALVLSVGLYILLLPRLDLDRYGMLLVLLLNMAVVIPFAVQQLKPRLLQFDRQYDRLGRSLKLAPWQRLVIEWPFIRSACLSAFALVMLLAMGDVAIFSIFGTADWTTLPWLIYGYAGTYRIAEASVASLLLLLICALVVRLFERGREHA